MTIWRDGLYMPCEVEKNRTDGVFTTLCVDNGMPWHLDRHLSRLRCSAKALGLILCDADFSEIIKTLSLKNGMTNAACRILLRKGHTLISLRAMPETNEAYRLSMVPDTRKSPELFRHKLADRRAYEGMKAAAALKEADDALIINAYGNVLETTAANIFFMRGNEIYTPPKSLAILPGIIRGIVMERADVTEKMINTDDLHMYDAAFITNSLKGIMPVRSVDGIDYDTAPVFSLKKKLHP